MTFLNLHFPDKQLENLFRASFNQSKLEKYMVKILIWLLSHLSLGDPFSLDIYLRLLS